MNVNCAVVIPLYNKAKSIELCLESIARQRVKPDHVVIVDDGSEDEGAELCEKFRSSFIFFDIIRQKNCGVSVARNVGLSAAKGDLIFLCDADDVWLVDHTYKIINAYLMCSDALIYTSQHTVVRGDVEIRPEKAMGQTEDDCEVSKNPIRVLATCSGIIHSSSVAINGHMLGAFPRFPPKVRIGEDWYVWMKSCSAGKFVFINSATVRVNKNFHVDKFNRRSDISYPLKVYDNEKSSADERAILGRIAKNECFSAILNKDREKLRLLKRYGWLTYPRFLALYLTTYFPKILVIQMRKLLWVFKGISR